MSDKDGHAASLPVLAAIGTLCGVIAIVFLLVTRAGQTEDGARDLLTALVSLAVGFTTFCGLSWIVGSQALRDIASSWRADHPVAHLHLPIWGTAVLLTLAYLGLFVFAGAGIDVLGLLFVSGVVQVFVLVVVARHLTRRLDRDLTGAQVDWTLNLSCAATGVPHLVLGLAVWALAIPVLTASPFHDGVIIVLLAVLLFTVLPYIGFAMVYGAGEALRHCWPRVFRRS